MKLSGTGVGVVEGIKVTTGVGVEVSIEEHEWQIAQFMDYHYNQRYHEVLDNLTSWTF
jgi:hypothetical protein